MLNETHQADLPSVDAASIVFTSNGGNESGERGGLSPAASSLPLLPAPVPDEADDVFTPAPGANPVVAALEQAGLHLEALGDGRHSVTCPWASEHPEGHTRLGRSAAPTPMWNARTPGG
jgi:hypothetical protein